MTGGGKNSVPRVLPLEGWRMPVQIGGAGWPHAVL